MPRWASTLPAGIAGTVKTPGTSTRTARYGGPNEAILCPASAATAVVYGAHGRTEIPPRRLSQHGSVSGRTQPSSAAVLPFETEHQTCKRSRRRPARVRLPDHASHETSGADCALSLGPRGRGGGSAALGSACGRRAPYPSRVPSPRYSGPVAKRFIRATVPFQDGVGVHCQPSPSSSCRRLLFSPSRSDSAYSPLPTCQHSRNAGPVPRAMRRHHGSLCLAFQGRAARVGRSPASARLRLWPTFCPEGFTRCTIGYSSRRDLRRSIFTIDSFYSGVRAIWPLLPHHHAGTSHQRAMGRKWSDFHTSRFRLRHACNGFRHRRTAWHRQRHGDSSGKLHRCHPLPAPLASDRASTVLQFSARLYQAAAFRCARTNKAPARSSSWRHADASGDRCRFPYLGQGQLDSSVRILEVRIGCHPQRSLLHSQIRGRHHSDLLPQSSLLGEQPGGSGRSMARDCSHDLEGSSRVRRSSLQTSLVYRRCRRRPQEHCTVLAPHHRLSTHQSVCRSMEG